MKPPAPVTSVLDEVADLFTTPPASCMRSLEERTPPSAPTRARRHSHIRSPDDVHLPEPRRVPAVILSYLNRRLFVQSNDQGPGVTGLAESAMAERLFPRLHVDGVLVDRCIVSAYDALGAYSEPNLREGENVEVSAGGALALALMVPNLASAAVLEKGAGVGCPARSAGTFAFTNNQSSTSEPGTVTATFDSGEV